MHKLNKPISLSAPIAEILKNILKPFPPIKHHPKDLRTLFKDHPTIEFQPDTGIESLVANPRPLPADELVATVDNGPQRPALVDQLQISHKTIAKELPVRVMVQSSDSANKYTITDGDYGVNDDSWNEGAAAIESDTQLDMQAVTEATPNIVDNASDKGTDKEDSPRTRPKERHAAGDDSEISHNTQPSTITVSQMDISTPTTTITRPNKRTGTRRATKAKKKEIPSLDRIAEKVFERYKNHEDIPSYEDLWYDDNGGMLLSQESDNTGKNVKRQVDNNKVVGPVSQDKQDKAKEELERLHEVTDVIDRFRGMLDIAQQVDYYLTKRLQSGINALAAMYADSPPNSFSDRR